ncbi:MAG: hypothetical protein ACLSB7_07785 [Parabacteroides distasonis]
MLVWSCFVPFDVRLEIVRGKRRIPAGTSGIPAFYPQALLRVVFGLLYYILTLARWYLIIRGREGRIRWFAAGGLGDLLGRCVHRPLLSSVLPTFIPRSRFYYSFGRQSCLAASPPTRFAIVPCHTAGILPLRLAPGIPAFFLRETDVESAPAVAIPEIDPETFRAFPGTQAFLRPGYKMTDLVEDLDVNRTVLSAFINQTYGMNFNRYLNRFRLRELDRLARIRQPRQERELADRR